MNGRKALEIVAEAAEIRAAQWERIGSGDEPCDTIAELYEPDDGEAHEISQRTLAAVHHLREYVRELEAAAGVTVVAHLQHLDLRLAEMIGDEQTKAEAAGDYSSGAGRICYPEDAAPEMDTARGLIQDAVSILQSIKQ